MEKKYTIYAFKQGNEILYIGMTCNPQKRFADHVRKANRRSKPKDQWIREQANNGTFTPTILFSNLSEEKAHQKERELLKRYNPIYNVLTYTRSPKNRQQSQTFEQWFTPYIHEYVHNYINS